MLPGRAFRELGMIQLNQNQKENINGILWSILALRNLIPNIIEIKENSEKGSYQVLTAQIYSKNLIELLLESQKLGTFGQILGINSYNDLLLANAFMANLKQVELAYDVCQCLDKITKKIFFDGIHEILINLQNLGFELENKISSELFNHPNTQELIFDLKAENSNIQ